MIDTNTTESKFQALSATQKTATLFSGLTRAGDKLETEGRFPDNEEAIEGLTHLSRAFNPTVGLSNKEQSALFTRLQDLADNRRNTGMELALVPNNLTDTEKHALALRAKSIPSKGELRIAA